jgi:hypothetical protein
LFCGLILTEIANHRLYWRTWRGQVRGAEDSLLFDRSVDGELERNNDEDWSEGMSSSDDMSREESGGPERMSCGDGSRSDDGFVILDRYGDELKVSDGGIAENDLSNQISQSRSSHSSLEREPEVSALEFLKDLENTTSPSSVSEHSNLDHSTAEFHSFRSSSTSGSQTFAAEPSCQSLAPQTVTGKFIAHTPKTIPHSSILREEARNILGDSTPFLPSFPPLVPESRAHLETAEKVDEREEEIENVD